VARIISDDDIQAFLRRNANRYKSQITLIQAAVDVLWPEGPPTGGAERVVRVCLESPVRRHSSPSPSGRLLPLSGTNPL